MTYLLIVVDHYTTFCVISMSRNHSQITGLSKTIYREYTGPALNAVH